MRKESKGICLLCCMLLVLISFFPSAAGGLPALKQEPSSVCPEVLFDETLSEWKQCADGSLPSQSDAANGTGLYLLVSTSSSRSAMHMMLKSPRLKVRGVFFAAVVLNLGLTALSSVWRFVNGTTVELVDVALGPHLVVCRGVGYCKYKRNVAGGDGGLVAVCRVQPVLRP